VRFSYGSGCRTQRPDSRRVRSSLPLHSHGVSRRAYQGDGHAGLVAGAWGECAPKAARRTACLACSPSTAFLRSAGRGQSCWTGQRMPDPKAWRRCVCSRPGTGACLGTPQVPLVRRPLSALASLSAGLHPRAEECALLQGQLLDLAPHRRRGLHAGQPTLPARCLWCVRRPAPGAVSLSLTRGLLY